MWLKNFKCISESGAKSDIDKYLETKAIVPISVHKSHDELQLHLQVFENVSGHTE